MSGIKCENLLAFIQILVTVDFTLFFLDENDKLTKLYENFISQLKRRAASYLNSAAESEIRAGNESFPPHGHIQIAWIRRVTNKIKYLTERIPDYDGWGMLGLFGGIYGLVCLLVIGLSNSPLHFYQEEFLLIFAQIILVLQSVIALRLMAVKASYRRNVVRIIELVLLGMTAAVVVVIRDWKFGVFETFETPFVGFSVLILLMPYIVAVGHVFCSLVCLHRHIYAGKRHCGRLKSIIDKYVYQREQGWKRYMRDRNAEDR